MIISAKYNLSGSVDAIIDGVQMTVPDDFSNRHRVMLAEWENEDNVIAPYVAPEPEPVITVIPAVTLWERMTEAEAEQVAEVMKTQPVRTVQIFNNATTFRSDHELWPLLAQIANDLFGEPRAAELLAYPSELVSNA